MSLFLVAFLTSLGLYAFSRSGFEAVLTYFPDANGEIERPELQYIPKLGDYEDHLRRFVEQVLLGPIDILKSPFLNPDTKLLALYYNRSNRLLVVNLSSHALRAHDSGPKSFGLFEGLEALTRNLVANFPALGQVEILIDGQIPGQPAFLFDGLEETAGI